jgi:NTE family protein
LRARQIVALFNSGERKGCYWGIRQCYPDGAGLLCPPDRTEELAAVATRLKRMEDSMQERLINWGYAICDATLRTRFKQDLQPAARFPYSRTGV